MKNKFTALIGISSLALLLSACSDSDVKVGDKDIDNTNIAQNNDVNLKDVEKDATEKKIDYKNDDFYNKNDSVTFEDFHGVGYAHNDGSIYFATHDGLKILNNNTWYTTDRENNDYMGFTPVDAGFYSSGHPGKNTSLPNPFGIVKSFNGNKTVLSLDLLQVSDFHIMDVGYYNNEIFVFNTHKSEKMDVGLYFSKDDTKTWAKANLAGAPQEVTQPAEHPTFTVSVHPKESGKVAIGTSDGLYISTDYGNTFTRAINETFQITSSRYVESGLLMGIWNGGPQLVKLTNDNQLQQISIPQFENEDAIMMLASNPKDENEIVLVSYKSNVYLTKDNGATWNTIAEHGKSK
jgi:phosphoribosyl-AMP cyclohydrolase